MMGIDFFDECSYQPNQLMYGTFSPQNEVFVFKEVEKEWLDPDAILSAHPEWTDPTRLPTSSRERKANQVTQQMLRENGWQVICAFGQTAEGKVVNEHTAMQITVVYACVISSPNSSQEF